MCSKSPQVLPSGSTMPNGGKSIANSLTFRFLNNNDTTSFDPLRCRPQTGTCTSGRWMAFPACIQGKRTASSLITNPDPSALSTGATGTTQAARCHSQGQSGPAQRSGLLGPKGSLRLAPQPRANGAGLLNFSAEEQTCITVKYAPLSNKIGKELLTGREVNLSDMVSLAPWEVMIIDGIARGCL